MSSIRALVRHWWFLPLILLPQLLPPFASSGYSLLNWGTVNAFILTHPIKGGFYQLTPLFQVIPLVLLVLIFLRGQRVSLLFSAYVALAYVLVAFLQNISISDRYGFAVCTANVMTILLLAGLWGWETISPQNEFQFQKKPVWEYWPLPLALFSFWLPVNPQTLAPDFNPLYLLTSGAGLSFCMLTPLILAVLLLYFPSVNKTVLVATAGVGLVMSMGNFFLEFVLYPAWWWIGVLHLPLFVLSFYSLAIALIEIVQRTKLLQNIPT